MNFLRLCAGCSGWFLAHAARYFDEPYYCLTCTKRRMIGFDPQPGDRVHHVDKQTGPFSDLLVISRDGDYVVVQPLGFPDRRQTEHVNSLVPPGYAIYKNWKKVKPPRQKR